MEEGYEDVPATVVSTFLSFFNAFLGLE